MKQRLLFASLIFALCTLLFYPQPVKAVDVVVGDGTPTSCTEAAFDAAWAQLYNDDGGTLTFNCGAASHALGFYTAKNVDDVQITVDGGGTITLQALTIQPGGSGTRLFQIFEGGFLTLQNIVLTGGRSPAGDGWGSQGGSIVLWDDAEDADPSEVASLTMRNSTIRNSYSSAWGGAIANEGGLVQLEQTGIYGSSAPYGGAFNGTGYETFVNVTVSGNTATQAGGGLRFWRSPRVSIAGSTITDNLANTLDGGGIDNQGAQVTIDQSYIEHNTAARHGGGIQNQGTLTMTNSSLALNSASQYHGGGINNNGLLIVRQSTLRGNSATAAGGALFNGNGALALTNNRIEGNVAGQDGGGIYVEGGSYTVAGSIFSQNSTKENGGGFFALNSSGVISQSLFYTNTAEAWGGGLGIEGGYATIWESDITENRAGSGGGIAVDDALDPTSGMKLTLRKTRLVRNRAEGGGGIFSYAGNISLYDSWLIDNQAKSGGGIYSGYSVSGSTYWSAIVYSSRSIFVNNRATNGFGGAIYHDANLRLVNSYFQGNRAVQGGGAIAMNSSANHPTADTEVAYTTFYDNQAVSGGALHNTGVQNTSLSSNRSLYAANTPDTCAGNLLASTGHNLTSDSSCGAAFTQAGDGNNVVLPTALQTYTFTLPTQPGAAFPGATFTVELHQPAVNSPALNRIPVGDCTNTLWDLFNRTRPVGAGCDVGALEVGAQTPIKFAQSITVLVPISSTVSQAPFTLNLVSSSGLPVIFSSGTPTVCTMTDATVTPVSTGTCTVVVSQNGDSAYAPAPPMTLTFQISDQSQPARATLHLPLVMRQN
jgi:hypothetical protein